MMSAFTTDQSKFQAVLDRDPASEGHFVYGVISTMICCRPTCSSRPPLKKNVIFFDTIEDAVSKGFISCKRCKPEKTTGWNRTRDIVAQACVIIMDMAKLKRKPNIDKIAAKLKVSKWHLCRTFKNYTGITPRQFYLKSLEGLDPLKSKPLPLIQTKKNLLKLKKMAEASKNDNSKDDVPQNSNDSPINDSDKSPDSLYALETPASNLMSESPALPASSQSNPDQLIPPECGIDDFLNETSGFNSREAYPFVFDLNDLFSQSFMFNDENNDNDLFLGSLHGN